MGHDLKRTLIACRRAGVEFLGPLQDVMVASYVLDPGRRRQDLAALASDFLGRDATVPASVLGTGKKRRAFGDVPAGEALSFACEQAELPLRLWEQFAGRLAAQGMEELFDELETPLIPVLADMELNGVGIDAAFFAEMSRRLAGELRLIREDIHRVAGTEFNINSTPQLREVLFERLELPVLKRTKTGPSTDSSVLERLAVDGHELPRLMMDYRQLEKLRNTYVDALPALVNPETRRIHTTFNQTVAATGRLSSSDPNLQNIPIRTDVGREIRRGFVAAPGTVLLTADYSQIELRILAHFSGDEVFVRAFREGKDVHPRDRGGDLRRTGRRGYGRHARPGQDRELRDALRPGTLRSRAPAGHLDGRCEAVHFTVLRALLGSAALSRRTGGAGEGAGVRGDSPGAAAVRARTPRPGVERTSVR